MADTTPIELLTGISQTVGEIKGTLQAQAIAQAERDKRVADQLAEHTAQISALRTSRDEVSTLIERAREERQLEAARGDRRFKALGGALGILTLISPYVAHFLHTGHA